MNYKTAKEFADEVKRELYEYEQDPEDIDRRTEEVRKQYEKTAKEYSFTFPLPDDFTAIKTKFQKVIDQIIDEFYNSIPGPLKEKFERHFCFATVDSKSIRAHIRRSSDRAYFGVFINSSLINLLTKIGKLDAALANPNCVVYCSRFPDSKPNILEIIRMMAEMFVYYSNFKMSHGPYFIIEGIEATTHFMRLGIQEKFIVYHEIAHFLNGDLFDTAEQQELISPFPNINYQREHLADILAFGLVLRSEGEKLDSKEYRLFIIIAIIHLFDIMYGLQKEEEEKHPLPLNRMAVIVESYFGSEVIELIEKTYEDRKAWQSLISQKLEFAFELPRFYASIDKMFESAFDAKNW